MNNILEKAIADVEKSDVSFCKYIQPNDTKATESNQAGYHLPKTAWPLFFETAGKKGEKKDVFATIKWQDDFETSSRFIYYGQKSRNEYRLTRFKRGFPYRENENIGDLLVLCRKSHDYFTAYVLSSDEDIEGFLAAVNISSDQTNQIITQKKSLSAEDVLYSCFMTFVGQLKSNFPTGIEISTQARNCYNSAFSIDALKVRTSPDSVLLSWLNAEFDLFKLIEEANYTSRIQKPFLSVEELIGFANSILNRRKSRAGKSLELHLSEVFQTFRLHFQTQTVTEGNKKPDFLFPSQKDYKNPRFDQSRLIMLASKTTCKDRWRQILNEADKIKIKHLFTLQQGISENQLAEMFKYNVQLVVPETYLKSFSEKYRDRILTLGKFVSMVESIQL